MKRFLSTTAVLLTMTGAAYADAHMGSFDVKAEQGDFFASNLIGMRIYNSETEYDNDATVAAGAEQEWDDIGEINDLIVNQQGEVTAVILGVGGFLGIGERDVSVSMDAIKIVREEGDGNDRFLVVNTTKEMLEQAPEFDRMQNDMEQAAAETEQVAENAAEETEQTAENMAAETEETAENIAAETEETAENMAAETEQVAENAAEETEEMAENAEANVEATTLDTERALLTRPTVEREGYAEVNMDEVRQMTADDLEGARIYGANDEDVGEIGELLVSDDGQIDRVLVDVGGFLGMGERTVAVSFEELQILKNADGGDVRIYIDSTEEKLEALPEYEE